ncbi:hypothetical protein [Lysobacter sp. ESA13C]|uniref:hypothetical protein n=1 Tax=unclassified Lysobacter TaxID=2635362 RepID=UPI001CBD2DA6|nr:hypothetical protein [Lysobacter sp. ESA13C]
MQRILIAIALAAAGVFAYLHWFAAPASDYRIAEIEQRPIPKREFFELWRETALGFCPQARENYGLSPAACEDYMRDKHARCVAEAGAAAPAVLSSKAESRRHARPYLDCVVPGYFCKGVEVRELTEAARHCRD